MTQLAFEKFKPTELEVLPNRPKSTKGFPFEFELGRRWYKSWDHFKRIWRSYNIDKYTKVCGGGSYKSDENIYDS